LGVTEREEFGANSDVDLRHILRTETERKLMKPIVRGA
jgi:hypothetical protein